MADELSPEQLKAEQERLDLIQKQSTAAKELASTYEKMAKSKRRLTDEDRELIGLSKQLSQYSSEIEKSIQKRISGTATSKDLAKQLAKLELDQKLNIKNSADLQRAIETNRTAALAKARQAARDEKKLKEDIAKLDESTTAAEIAKQVHLQNGNAGLAKQAADTVKENQKIAAAKEKQLALINKEKEAQKDLVKQLDEAAEANEKTKEQQEKEIELTKEALKQKQKEEATDALKKQFRIDEIKNMLTLEGLLLIIVNHLLRFNIESVKISKNLGYGAENADRVTKNIALAANHSSNLNFTLKNAGEAMGQLNEATGGAAEYSADTLETQIMLTKQLGLSGEEAAGIYKFSVLTGKASSTINSEMAAAFANTRNMVKGSANFKSTMAEVAKVSGQLAANFRNNPAAITEAVVKAQALGTTLEKTKSQGEKLLDFESSIESELKAELLTGQQMNLERARAAALQGDQVTVMKELANQGMTLNKFQNMNVLAQKSFAEALGLSADELSEQLKKQKIAQEQGKSLAEITAEEAMEAEKRQNLQDKFNAAVEKLQDFFGNLIAGPVGEFVSLLGDALDLVTSILYPFQLMFDFTSKIGQAIFGWVDKLGVFGKILKVVAGIGIVMAAMATYTAVATALAATIVGGIAAPIIAGAAAASVLALGFGLLNTKPAGDMISPADGKTQVSTKEGGLFELSSNDDLLAGPGLASKGKNKGESISPKIDLTPMIAAINQVKASVDRLYSKDQSIHMDGKKVGNTLSQGSYKVA